MQLGFTVKAGVLRVLALVAVPAVGFALGWLSTASHSGLDTVSSGQEPRAASLSALPINAGSAGMLSRVAALDGVAEIARISAYLNLIEAARLDEFPDLVTRMDRELSKQSGISGFLLGELLKRWVNEDPMGALDAVLKGARKMRFRAEFVAELLAKAGELDSWPVIRADPNRWMRDKISSAFLETLADSDPAATLGILKGLQPASDASLIRSILRKVAATSPQQALEFAEDLPPGAFSVSQSTTFRLADGTEYISRELAHASHGPASTVAVGWVESDPAAAIKWAEGLQHERREAVLERMVDSWANKQPAAATDYAFTHPKGVLKTKILKKLLENRNVPLNLRRRAAENVLFEVSFGQSQFIEHWLPEDPIAVSAWLAERDQKVAVELIKSAAEAWSHSDRESAALRIVEIPDPGMRQAAIEAAAPHFWNEEIEMAPEVRAVVYASEPEKEEG